MRDAINILSNNGYDVRGVVSSGAHGDCVFVKKNDIAYIIKVYKDNDKQESLHEEEIYTGLHGDGLGKDYLFKAEHIELDGSFFLKLTTYEGKALEEFFSQESDKISIAEKIDVLINACETISQMHKSGYLHMDIKLSNFYISKNLAIKPIDMGSAVELVKKEKDKNSNEKFREIMENLGYLSTDSYASFRVKKFNKLRNEYMDLRTDSGEYLLSDEEKEKLIDIERKISVKDDIYSLIITIFKALTGLLLGNDIAFDEKCLKTLLTEKGIEYSNWDFCNLFLSAKPAYEKEMTESLPFESVGALIEELEKIKRIENDEGFDSSVIFRHANKYFDENFKDIVIDEELLTDVEEISK